MLKYVLKLMLGPALLIVFVFMGLNIDMPENAAFTLGITAWVASWWVTEVIPIPVTSLLPMVLFPMFSVLTMDESTVSYSDKLIWLYVGGFIIALALEKWNVHIRIAKLVLVYIGTNLNTIIFGFMLACFLLSMWISNTATALMMLPIADSLLNRMDGKTSPGFGKALMLGVAYSCSIGGMATLIGTPTNLVLSGMVEKSFGVGISFYQWFIIGFPISCILLVISWLVLIRVFKPGDLKMHLDEIKIDGLGYEEKRILFVFFAVAISWVTRPWLIEPYFPFINDTIIAMIGAIILFLLPSKNREEMIMDWKSAKNLPWGIVLLFGGGLTIAKAFQVSGLATWFGENLTILQILPYILVLFIVSLIVNFLTEVTSNVATASVFLPVMAGVALAMNVHPFPILTIVCLAASCAFMLPVATPPNAIVFGSGRIKMNEMVKAGIWLNVISVCLITLYVFLVMSPLWDINLYEFPATFK
ncbi:MAG: SLC13 family permease [Saprospiraceae bacterium]